MEWETVIGLEIHTQLKTRSKIFSGAATAYGAEPNTQACAVDLALPGVLPVMNRDAARMAVKFGLAIGAKINHGCGALLLQNHQHSKVLLKSKDSRTHSNWSLEFGRGWYH